MNARNTSRRKAISPPMHIFLAMHIFISGCDPDVSFQSTDPDSQRSSSGLDKTESFAQGIVSKKLDILFVVDNSGSMAEEQQKMGEKIDRFIDSLYDVDWQIGVTTTDVSDGKYGLKGDLLTFVGTQTNKLTKKVPNYATVFKNTVQRSESYSCGADCASGDEQPLRAAIQAIEKRMTSNRGFFRSEADLGLLILSDEDEMSSGPAHATPPASVLSTFDDAWGDSKRLLTYGMIITPGDTTCLALNNTGGHFGTFVAGLAALTGGIIGSICAEDYAPTLGLLADHARSLLEYVQLKYLPVPESIEIQFTPNHSTTWRIERRRLYFSVPPPKDTLITVNYTVL